MYRVKHVPSGLYYQPKTQYGSNLSKKGKVYHGMKNGLSPYINDKEKYLDTVFYIFADVNTITYKQTLNIFNWENTYQHNEKKAITYIKDWIMEEI